MEFDMNDVTQVNNNTPQVESQQQENQRNGDSGEAGNAGANLDTHTLAAVLQFLQKHNLKVVNRFIDVFIRLLH